MAEFLDWVQLCVCRGADGLRGHFRFSRGGQRSKTDSVLPVNHAVTGRESWRPVRTGDFDVCGGEGH